MKAEIRRSLMVWVLTLAICTSIGWQLYFDIGHLKSPSIGGSGGVLQAAPTQGSSLVEGGISDIYLMGTPPVEGVSSKQKTDIIPETRLNIQLRGLFASDTGQLGGVVLDVGGGKSGFYKFGDEVSNGARVSGVANGGVILDREGKQELLKFDYSSSPPESYSQRSITSSNVSRQSSSIGSNVPSNDRLKSSNSANMKSENADRRMKAIKDRLAALREKQNSNRK